MSERTALAIYSALITGGFLADFGGWMLFLTGQGSQALIWGLVVGSSFVALGLWLAVVYPFYAYILPVRLFLDFERSIGWKLRGLDEVEQVMKQFDRWAAWRLLISGEPVSMVLHKGLPSQFVVGRIQVK